MTFFLTYSSMRPHTPLYLSDLKTVHNNNLSWWTELTEKQTPLVYWRPLLSVTVTSKNEEFHSS